jgi:ribosomal protein S3
VAKLEGFKIQISGRLNGAEIARTEWVRKGRVPLQTLELILIIHQKCKNNLWYSRDQSLDFQR